MVWMDSQRGDYELRGYINKEKGKYLPFRPVFACQNRVIPGPKVERFKGPKAEVTRSSLNYLNKERKKRENSIFFKIQNHVN